MIDNKAERVFDNLEWWEKNTQQLQKGVEKMYLVQFLQARLRLATGKKLVGKNYRPIL